jgi:alkylated DNA nucleotide flippase Atl1
MVREPGRVSGAPSEFAEDVLEVVDTIPTGMVMTYGDIAELLGRGGARGVGNTMARYGSDVPWWRVVRAGGFFPQGLEDEALAHYREEGTPLVRGQLDGRRVDLARARWREATVPVPPE